MCCMEKDGAVTQRQAEKDDGRHVRLREREEIQSQRTHLALGKRPDASSFNVYTRKTKISYYSTLSSNSFLCVCVCVVSFSRLLCVKQLKLPRYSLLRRINARKEQAPNGFPFWLLLQKATERSSSVMFSCWAITLNGLNHRHKWRAKRRRLWCMSRKNKDFPRFFLNPWNV
jgi:hypothetical protein